MHALAALLVVFLFVATPLSAQFASEPQRRDAWQHYRTGEQLMAAEQFAKAADAFHRAIAQDRLMTLAHYRQGQAYMELRRFASAARAFVACREAFRTLHGLAEGARQEVERQREDEMRELREVARRLAADRRRSRDAEILQLEARIDDLDRHRTSLSSAFEPPAFVSLALGSAYFRSDQLEDAEREWKAAVAANARFGEAHNNLAALYAMTGRKQEAQDAVRAAEQAGFPVHPHLKADIDGL